MVKDTTEKYQKKVVPSTWLGPSGASTQLRVTLGSSNNERTLSPADITYTHPELINTVWEG